MKHITDVSELRQQISQWKQQGERIAFVPTMGNLHQGHLSLVSRAKALADSVVVSIFVNPLQFDDKADLAAYPRTLDRDIAQLNNIECDAVFTPTAELMYPTATDEQTLITVPGVDDKLCGLARTGHFDGVATVVAKLFNMVQADIALLGEKDYQQLLLVKKMVADLNMPIEITGVPTFRNEQGLALSSRNQYLSKAQKQQAASLYQTLIEIKESIQQHKADFLTLENRAMDKLKQLGFKPDYVAICNANNLLRANVKDKELRILLAARLGTARLIDNIACDLD